MLNHEEKILLEQYISGVNLKKDDLDQCVQLIRHLKDVANSDFYIDENDCRSYEIVTMQFQKKGNKVTFDGGVSTDKEYRWVNGNITRRGNSFVVMSHYYRFNSLVDEFDKEYSVVDVFNATANGIKRKSAYVHNDTFSIDIVHFDDEELEQFYKKIIGRGYEKELHI